MLLLFSIRVSEWPYVWERAVHSVFCACLSWAFVKFCVCLCFHFGIEGRMWDVIVLIRDHCLSSYFSSISRMKSVFGQEVTAILRFYQLFPTSLVCKLHTL